MEYGMNTTLKIEFDGLKESLLEKIEFMFKQENKNNADPIKRVTWRAGVRSDDVYTLDNSLSCFYVPFLKEDTFKCKPGRTFYADARIHYTDTRDNPQVKVVPIRMGPGLFGSEDGET